jgi:D-aminopeptidase
MVRRPHMPGTPRRMVREGLQGIILVGQHARYGGDGFAPHTIQSPPIEAITINGIKVGEIGLELALFMDVKLLAVVGEEAATTEARELCPHVVTIPVKSLERNWFPRAKENYPVIKEKVWQALRQPQNAEGLHLDPPYRFSLTLTENFTFDPGKRFFLRGLAKTYFFGRYKGRMDDGEAFWQAKTIAGGLSALQAARLFVRKRAQS